MINLTGYITNKTSYGLVTLNLIKVLIENGKNVALHTPNTVAPRDLGAFSSYIATSQLSAKGFDPKAPSFRVAHQFDMAYGIGLGKRIGYTFFEMDRLSPLEQRHLRSLDLVLVPTKWAKSVIDQYDIPCGILNAGYDDTVFKPQEYIAPTCNFFMLGKWEVRKQHRVVVETFAKAFGRNHNVKLYLSMTNPFLPQKFIDDEIKYYKSLLGDQLTIVDKLPINELARFIQQMYCIVAPSLAEGWNLPLLEAMACGKFSIATNYSGHTEFCTEKTTFLLDVTETVPAEDGMWFRPDSEINCGNWAKYDHEQLISYMQHVYLLYKSGITLNKDAADRAKSFTWQNSYNQLKEVYDS